MPRIYDEYREDRNCCHNYHGCRNSREDESAGAFTVPRVLDLRVSIFENRSCGTYQSTTIATAIAIAIAPTQNRTQKPEKRTQMNRFVRGECIKISGC